MDSDKWTDAELERLEKRIRKEYDKAQKELGEKAAAYFQEYEERFKREELAMLTSSLSKDEVESKWVDIYGTNAGFETWYRKADHAYGQDEYQAKLNFQKWEMAQLGRGQHWYDMRDQMAQRLTEANQIAAGYINNVLPGIYVANNNGVAKIAQDAAMEQGIMGVRFDLVDEYTVRNLMVESSDVRPYKPVNISIDESSKWSKNKLQNALLQGILQGDSIGDIADRFETVTGMNRNAAIRNARTATTNAQNAGKQDRFADLASKGCIFNKMWIATHDERTRDEHRDADRQEVDYNSTFDVGGEDLMYPGDPSASGWNRYNCRCTMRATNIRFRSVLSDADRKKANIRLKKQMMRYDNGVTVFDEDGRIISFAIKERLVDMSHELNHMIDSAVSNSKNPAVRKVWDKLKDNIIIGDAFCSVTGYLSGRVVFDVLEDAKETPKHHPWSSIIHEAFHNFDDVKGKGKTHCFTYEYKDNLLGRTAQKEAEKLILQVKDMLSEETEWLYVNGYITESQLMYYKSNGGWGKNKPLITERMACHMIENMITMKQESDYRFISDILEGATNNKIHCGYGHKKGYWEKDPTNLPSETLADIASAECTSEEGIELIKKLLPETYQVYNEILNEMAGA